MLGGMWKLRKPTCFPLKAWVGSDQEQCESPAWHVRGVPLEDRGSREGDCGPEKVLGGEEEEERGGRGVWAGDWRGVLCAHTQRTCL